MAKPPKLTAIEELDDFSHWLADTIQEKASKENAGFVQIVRETGDTRERVVINPGGGVRFVALLTKETNS